MSRIGEVLNNKKSFITFVTAGDPSLDITEKLIYTMEKGGSDLIEIGIPFSDPVAEGPVIQRANERALKNKCTTDDIFEMVKKVRKNTNIPLVFLTYFNPVFTYGIEKFVKKCEEVGIDGLIIPDLPFEEKEEVTTFSDKHGVDLISLIAPTSEERIKMISKEAKGFLYVVSSLGVTGVRTEFNKNLSKMIEVVKQNTNIPCAIGFGISNPEQAKEMSQIADGVIIGSAIVKIVEEYGENSEKPVYEFVKSVKESME